MRSNSRRVARVLQLIRDGSSDETITRLTGFGKDVIQQMRRDNARWKRNLPDQRIPDYGEPRF